MARFNLDLSEYQRSEYSNYLSQWNGCAELIPSFFDNNVTYSAEEKKIYLNVSLVYEYESMCDLYEELGCFVPEEYQQSPTQAEVDAWRAELDSIRKKFGSTFQVQPPVPAYPDDVSEHCINAFSGTTMVVPLGEGILNFCYADFGAAFDHCVSSYQALAQTIDVPQKIRNAKEGVIRIYELYAEVFPVLSEVYYSSAYSACFPPQFVRKTAKALNAYRQYLSLLQTEFLELIEFCLDKDYRPEVLSRLYPSERYSLWCKIKDVPSSHERRETFLPDSYDPRGTTMPFGIDLDAPNINEEVILTPEQKAFAKEFGLSEYELAFRYKYPCFISSSYSCNNLRDMLYLEFSKILEAGLEFQKCRRCGRYFIVKGNYHGAYCDRIAEGEHRTCQQLAAQETYLNKLKDNDGKNALSIYQKYYKRYFARVQAGSLKREKFKQWQYQAVQKRDACLDGKVSLEELADWLEASMSNRKKRNAANLK